MFFYIYNENKREWRTDVRVGVIDGKGGTVKRVVVADIEGRAVAFVVPVWSRILRYSYRESKTISLPYKQLYLLAKKRSKLWLIILQELSPYFQFENV